MTMSGGWTATPAPITPPAPRHARPARIKLPPMPTPISTPAPNHARLARMNRRTYASTFPPPATAVARSATAPCDAACGRVQRCRIQDPDASALLLDDPLVAEPGERAGDAFPRRRQPARQLLLRLRQDEGAPVVADARRLRGLD